ncbi:hypothetical protein ABZ570_10545 [Micromonospora sp. NPDC007271]|uniref:hypothetical protein n=1 Tax=Micromonospora sp. NPDC007271 TaxID=3154587 RepID=UPI0033F6C76F
MEGKLRATLGRRVRWLVTAAAGVGLTAGSLLLWRIRKGLEEESWVVAIVGGVVALLVAVRPVVDWARSTLSPATSTPTQLDEAQQKLADVVLAQWRDEAAVRQLDRPMPLAVAWRPADPDLMDHPSHVTAAEFRFVGRTDDIATIAENFRKLRRRRLVIIGGGGTGKTTLAVLLLRQLLATRRSGEPVPVLFSLSSWDPRAEAFHVWLSRKLAQDYPMLRIPGYGGNAPASLVRSRRILPVLDGMDELPEAVRPRVLGALNAQMSDADGLILTCRTNEYRAAIESRNEVLSGAAVISPSPLAAAYVRQYLNACLSPATANADRWRTFMSRLHSEPTGPLATALSTPLTLWLLRSVYVGTRQDPTPLADPARFPTPLSITHHLIDNLVEATFAARRPAEANGEHVDNLFRPRRRWGWRKAREWLAYLAVQLDERNVRDLSWWWLHYAIFRRQRRIVSGLLGGLLGGLTVGLASAPAFGLEVGLVVGLTVGMSSGLAAGLTITPSVEDPSYANLRWLRRAQHIVPHFALCLSVGLAAGIAAGAAVGMALRAAVALALGLTVALLAGGTVGLIAGLRAEASAYANLRLRGRVRILVKYLAIGTVAGSVAGLVVGSAIGLAFAVGIEFGVGMRTGVAGALAVGLSFGIAFGLREWARRPLNFPHRSSPAFTLRGDLTSAGLVLGTIVAGVGVTFGVPFGVAYGASFGLAIGLTVAAASRQASIMYLIAKTHLFATGRMPWRLMAFMEDSHRLGLLRQVGAVYQFRHADLQDRLARTYEQPRR